MGDVTAAARYAVFLFASCNASRRFPPGLLYSLQLQLQLLGDAARALLDASRRIALRRVSRGSMNG